MEYQLRSDFGTIDLSDGFDPARVADTSLSLIGQQGAVPAIQVADGAEFDLAAVTLGGVDNFTYTRTLADAFNPISNPDLQRITLRAGLSRVGVLGFESGVTLRAPRIELAATDGTGNTFGSTVAVAGANFDFTGATGDRVFLFQEDQTFALSDLPTTSQFVGGVLPSVLAIRNDGGQISLTNPDFTSLPLDLSSPARLVLEALQITLAATGARDLELTRTSSDSADPTALDNLRVRLRTNELSLTALGGTADLAGEVLAGNRSGAAAPASGNDAAFDDPSLLIEGFDSEGDLATTGNLSRLSQDADDPNAFDLTDGVGPRLGPRRSGRGDHGRGAAGSLLRPRASTRAARTTTRRVSRCRPRSCSAAPSAGSPSRRTRSPEATWRSGTSSRPSPARTWNAT